MTPPRESDILVASLSVIISYWPFIRWGVWVHPSFHVYTLQGDYGVCSTPLHMELIPPPRFQIEVTPLVHVEAAPQPCVHSARYHVIALFELVALIISCYTVTSIPYIMLYSYKHSLLSCYQSCFS